MTSQLAEKLGVPRRYLSRWENGHAVPADENREALLAALPKLRRRDFAVARPGNAEAAGRAQTLEHRVAELEGEMRALRSAIEGLERLVRARQDDD